MEKFVNVITLSSMGEQQPVEYIQVVSVDGSGRVKTELKFFAVVSKRGLLMSDVVHITLANP